jgi:glycosyltransferase involved in cell wall biosynthesis
MPPLEAMASGTSVVTTNCGGISGFIEFYILLLLLVQILYNCYLSNSIFYSWHS